MKPEIMQKNEAIQTVRRMRKRGWSMAHIEQMHYITANQEIENGYCIITHQRNCHCGLCPTLRVNGFVE